jgi:hypothetical protein
MAFNTSDLSQSDVQKITAAGQSGMTNIGGIDYAVGGVTGGGEDGGFTAQEILGYQPGQSGALADRSQFGLSGQYQGMGKNENGGAMDGAGMIALAIITGGAALELGLLAGFAGGGAAAVDPAAEAFALSDSVYGGSAASAGEMAGGAAAGGGATFNAAADSQLASSQLGLTGADTSTLGAANSVTVNAATGTPGALTGDSITTAVQSAVSQGSSLTDAMKAVAAKAGIPVSSIVSALGAAGNAIGNGILTSAGLGPLLNAANGAISAEAAKSAGDQIAAGAQKAADILSPAYTNAANTLASGYTTSAAQRAAGALQGAQTLASGYSTAAGQEVAGLNLAQGAADRTLAAQKEIQQPYQAAGAAALKTLSDGLATGGQFNKQFSMADMANVMPAYTFARDQAEEALRNQMAAGGQALGVNAATGAGKLAAGLASQYEGQAFNQWLAQNNLTLGALQSMVNTGQVSTAQLQAALAANGFTTEQIQTAIGAAQGAGTLGAAKATSTGQQLAADYTGGGTLGAAGAQSQGIMGSAGAQANAAQQGANAHAAGTVGTANALTGAISNVGNSLIGNAALQAARGITRPYTMSQGTTYTDPTSAAYSTDPALTTQGNSSNALDRGANYDGSTYSMSDAWPVPEDYSIYF